MVPARRLPGEFVFADLTDESLSGIVANVKEFLQPFTLPTSVKGTGGHVCVRFLPNNRSR